MDLLVALLLKPPAHQLELLPVVGGLDADLLVGKLGNAEFEYVRWMGACNLGRIFEEARRVLSSLSGET